MGREGAVRGAREGRCRFFIENPRRGGGLPGGGRGWARAGRVSAGNLGGRGAIFFCRGRNGHQVRLVEAESSYRPRIGIPLYTKGIFWSYKFSYGKMLRKFPRIV